MATLMRFIVLGKKPTDKKRDEGTFHYRNMSGDEFIFYYGFKLNQKIAARENYRHYGYILIRKQ